MIPLYWAFVLAFTAFTITYYLSKCAQWTKETQKKLDTTNKLLEQLLNKQKSD